MTIKNAMTVDVEDYFQVSAFERHIPKCHWDSLPQRVAANTHRILDLFAHRQVKATFFTLAWVGERNPGLVRRIAGEGHELACHGYDHTRVSDQTPDQFRDDIRKSKRILEDLAGVEVIGYRAASYSINRHNLWAQEVLQQQGFRYSSSIYPVKHDLYGIPDAPRFIHQPLPGHEFYEIPITSLRLPGLGNRPCGGGGFFRLYPYALSKWAFRHINRHEAQPGIFYFHPWEIDPNQPRQTGISLKTRIRHYLNLGLMEGRIGRLLDDFAWDTMANVFLTAK